MQNADIQFGEMGDRNAEDIEVVTTTQFFVPTPAVGTGALPRYPDYPTNPEKSIEPGVGKSVAKPNPKLICQFIKRPIKSNRNRWYLDFPPEGQLQQNRHPVEGKSSLALAGFGDSQKHLGKILPHSNRL